MKAESLRTTLGNPRVGAVLLALGALCAAGSALTGLCRIQPTVAYASSGVLAVAATGTALDWAWARLVGRIAAWLNVFLFAMLIVPDWDDAALTDVQHLHGACGLIAVYFALCAVGLGFRTKATQSRDLAG